VKKSQLCFVWVVLIFGYYVTFTPQFIPQILKSFGSKRWLVRLPTEKERWAPSMRFINPFWTLLDLIDVYILLIKQNIQVRLQIQCMFHNFLRLSLSIHGTVKSFGHDLWAPAFISNLRKSLDHKCSSV
jgi:hypothetical protein